MKNHNQPSTARKIAVKGGTVLALAGASILGGCSSPDTAAEKPAPTTQPAKPHTSDSDIKPTNLKPKTSINDEARYKKVQEQLANGQIGAADATALEISTYSGAIRDRNGDGKKGLTYSEAADSVDEARRGK